VCAAVAFIPFGSGGSVENPKCRVMQWRCEISVDELLPNDFNVLNRNLDHNISEKAPRSSAFGFRTDDDVVGGCVSRPF
jgi:hypothetical protein